MNKKTLITIIIIIILFIGICISSYLYSENNYFEKWLICEYKTKYSNYTETLKFNYIDDTLYEYTRDEYLGASKDNSLDDIYEFFSEEKKKYEEIIGDNFKYNVGETDDAIHIYTYMKTIANADFFNSYIEEKDITINSTIEEIRDKLSDEYDCHIEKR